ncbi:BZIP domain-containing protein [Favolaschia claudopus]|uniref:BZIP domain-containing protein n=1 Tax=Favolaschia claudopus TaxID=2862362 RepID=A0AAW0EBH7_9AGAR
MTERSVSVDNDSDRESSTQPGKPGRKKNPNSQAARRDQNRIAQREFRLRKQQKVCRRRRSPLALSVPPQIRDLETRVEILSGGTDQAVSELKNMLKDLMDENQTLRTLLRSLGAFIGEGAGGLLPKLGWDVADFHSFINRSETDTAWQGYQRRKKANEAAMAAQGGQKRSADEDGGNARKKTRANDHEEPAQNGYPVLVGMNPGNNLYGRDNNNAMFNDIMRGGSNGSPMFSNPSPTANASPTFASGSQTSYQNSYMSGVNMGVESSLPPLSFNPVNPSPGVPSATPIQPPQTNQMSPPEPTEEDDDPNKSEAYKLIHYHLDNYKRNTAYCLPSSLRPTLVQRTVPHESVIDRILHPELRDRMILLRGRFDLVDCLLDYRNAVTIHGDDVLAHGNWEISEKWLRQYGFLVDPATLNIVNRWRRERGEPELRIADITSTDSAPATT